jgi:hypothetical protein
MPTTPMIRLLMVTVYIDAMLDVVTSQIIKEAMGEPES